MSEQHYQSTGGTGQQMHGGQMGQMGGQQSGQSHRMTHEQVGHQFESEMTTELNEALESFDRVVEIAEWCADKCIEGGPQMAECARLCEDLSDLASLNEKLIARDSINGPEVAEAFMRVAQQGLPILQQHQQPHVQETYQAVQQAMDSTNRLLQSISGGQQSPTTGIREQVQQQGGQMGMGQQGGQMGVGPQSGQMGMDPQSGQMGMGQQGGQMGQSSQPPGQSFQGSQPY